MLDRLSAVLFGVHQLLPAPALISKDGMLQVWVALGILTVITILWCLLRFGIIDGVMTKCYGITSVSKDHSQYRLPPGSFGLPFIGETLHFAFFNSARVGHPLPFLAARKRRYGNVFKSHLMGRPALVSMDPDLNKLLLTGEGKIVQASYPSFITKIVGPWLNAHGARHRLFRDLTSTRLSIPAIQTFFLNEVQADAQHILQSWKDRPLIHFQQEAMKFLFRLMLKITVGMKQEDNETVAGQLLADIALLSGGYSAIPVDLPGTPYNKVLKARRRIGSFLSQLARARRIKQLPAENAETNDLMNPSVDLMSVLVNERDEFGNPLTDEEISELVFSLIYGGFEMSTVFLTFLIKFLSDSPSMVEKLREEHTRIRMSKLNGTNDHHHHPLSWGDYQQMEFTQMVINETLRLSSITHYVLRESIEHIHYKGMVIPKGWLVLVNLSMVHLDPIHYPQPSTFDPWRWQNCAKNFSFLAPFGGGLRTCLGNNLVKFEVAIFLHYLVTTFRWTPMVEKDTQGDCVSALSFPTVRNGLPIKVHPI